MIADPPTEPGPQSRTILLLEDDESDVFLFRRILTSLDSTAELRVVSSVMEARRYMLGEERFSDRVYYPLPDIIVAAFGLCGETGVDFIRWLKMQPKFVHLPVAVFSRRMMPSDRAVALALGLGRVYSKAGDFGEVKQQVQQLLKDTEARTESDAPA